MAVGGGIVERDRLAFAKSVQGGGDFQRVAMKGRMVAWRMLSIVTRVGAGTVDQGQMTRSNDTSGFFGEKTTYRANAATSANKT